MTPSILLLVITDLLIQSLTILYVYFLISHIKPKPIFMLLFIAVTFYCYIYLNQFLLFLAIVFLLWLYSYKNNSNKNNHLNYFYSIFSFFPASVLGYFFSNFLLPIPFFNVNLSLSASLFSVLTIQGLLFLFRPNLDFLQKNIDIINKEFLLIINTVFTLCGLILYTNYWYERIIAPNQIRNYMLLLFTTTIIALMSYLSNKIRQFEIQQKIQAQEEQEQSLITYIHQVENTYNEIKGFQHDYHNVLISLNESIQSNDLTRIKNTYQEILTNEKIDFKSGVHQLPKLANIKILPIKGIIAAKMNQAFADDRITIEVEITEPIEEVSIATLDYVRILSIFLDNALEEARQTKQPMISLAIFSTPGGGQQLIVENTCVEKRIDTIQLAEKGYSTKGLNRGIGLSNLETIIGSYDHLSLETSCDDHIFRQVIIFYH